MRHIEGAVCARAWRLVAGIFRRLAQRRSEGDGALRGKAQRWPADVALEQVCGNRRCRIDVCVRSALGADTCDDVAIAVESGASLIVGVSDGAGPEGGAAARLVAERFAGLAERRVVGDLDALTRQMSVLDNESTSLDGAATAVVGQIWNLELLLVAAGDSEAWAKTGNGPVELTRGQPKRRLGDGIGAALAIGPLPLAGPVIIASDGLWRRVGPESAFVIWRAVGCDRRSRSCRRSSRSVAAFRMMWR